MPIPLDAPEVLEREFLGVRAKLLEVGATLDRIDRAEGRVEDDRRMALIRRGLEILSRPDGDRAEQIQLLFSLDYDDGWREKFSAVD